VADPRLAGPPAGNSNPLIAALDVPEMRGVLGAVLLRSQGGPAYPGQDATRSVSIEHQIVSSNVAQRCQQSINNQSTANQQSINNAVLHPKTRFDAQWIPRNEFYYVHARCRTAFHAGAHSGLQAVILVISPIQLHEKQRNQQCCATLEDTI